MTLTFERLELENIRSYDDGEISFEGGENLIFGANGAGKSTILQGIFGGLFQTAITYQVGSSFDLADLIRKGKDEGRLVLTFGVSGHEYTVEWRIEKTYDDGEPDGAKTKSGYPRLSSDALDEEISQVGNVRREIHRLLGMDAESFVNSVYIQQGDITRLIHADTETRREILDGLLGLNHIDDLVDRMDAVRLEYGKAERDAKAKHAETGNRLDDLPDRDEVEAKIQDTVDEIDDQKDDLAKDEEDLEDAREHKSDTENKLDRIDDIESDLDVKREKLADAEDDHERHKESLENEQAEKRTVERERDEMRDELDALRDREAVADVDLSTKENAERAHETAQRNAESARSEVQSIEEGTLSTLSVEQETLETTISDIEDDIYETEDTLELATEKKETAEERRSKCEERVADLEADHDEKCDDIADRADALGIPRNASLDALSRSHIPEKRRTLSNERETLSEERGRLTTLEDQVDELAATGECPVCGASEDAHDIDADAVAAEHAEELTRKNDRLDELRNRQDDLTDLGKRVNDALEFHDDLEDAREAVADAEADIEECEEKIEECEAELESFHEQLAEKRDEHETKREERTAAEEELEDARERVDVAETREQVIGEVVALYDDIEDHERKIDQHEGNIENVRELRRQAHDRVRELESDIEDLREDLGGDDPDALRAEITDIEELIAEINEEKAELEDHIEELTGRVAELNQTKHRIRTERERRAMLDDQVTWASERHDEAEAVMESYREVRGKLRKRNLAKLNRYTNEMFADLYQSHSYRGVQIDKKYNIHLIAADGELIAPELSSGGESTILNLALRAGVYRIIAERDGVAGSALPPFILDEPTTYLDDEHVGELKTMIQTISEWNVPQILVVSHDETLIENSDHAVFVEKDPATETSRIREGHVSAPIPQNEAELADD